MGFYGEQVVPRVTNIALGSKEFGKVRREVCAGLHGDVIEIGFGSGLNLAYLPPEVDGVWTVEPSGVAQKLAAKRVESSPVEVHVGALNGELLPFDDDRFDAALSTMTLCTIPDVASALRELRRVLRPGASFHFAEHGRAPDDEVVRWQNRLNRVQNVCAGGCNLNRPIDGLLTDAGFEIDTLRRFYLKGPKTIGAMYLGTARKP